LSVKVYEEIFEVVPFPLTSPTSFHSASLLLSILKPELLISEEVLQFNVTVLLLIVEVNDDNSTGNARHSE